ncbi:MAG: chemotaxis protein CheX [Nitrospinota bacterium]
MDIKYINPFLNATVRVLETMAFVKPTPGKPFLKKDKLTRGDISGIIGLTGEKKGAIVLSLSKEAAIKIVSSMLGETYTSLTDEITDAIGELTNIIAGDARRELAEGGHTFEAGIPTITTGKGHAIETITKGPVVAIPFTVDNFPFLVEASFEP